jgi:hypothetical protein
MRSIIPFVCVLALCAGVASAQQTVTCGWEDGVTTIIGEYPPGEIIATNVSSPVHSGTRSLQLEDASPSATPQAFVAWITGLSGTDSVYASVWRYDDTPGASPSCRIWAHWNDDPADINGYAGSAGGNSDYGPGTGWDMTDYTWVNDGTHTGLVIEIRTYSNPGDTVWIDDLTVTIPDTANFEQIVPVQLQTFSVE